MSPDHPASEPSRRAVLSGTGALLASAGILCGSPRSAEAKDYASRGEALDDLDRLASACGMRLGAVRRSRAGADLLAMRFLNAIQRHRAARDDVRRQFGLPRGSDPATVLGADVDLADLASLRQALDDLMVAYAESLPVLADSGVVSRLAVDMVEVSRLRTVIDLWVEAESS